MPQRIDVHFGGGKQPNLHMVIEVVDGVPSCTSLMVARTPGGHEVRTKGLRLVRLEDRFVYVGANGRWEARLTYTDPDTGRVERVSFYGPTARAVRKKMKDARDRLDAGAPVKGRTQIWPCGTFIDARVVHHRASRVVPKWSQKVPYPLAAVVEPPCAIAVID